MNGSSIFLDTNIILYLLSGDETVAEFLNNKNIFISFVTELELLGYKDMDPEELPAIENLLADITIVDINTEIKKTEKDYNQALKRLEKTFHASSDSEEGDEAEVLVYFD
jgi:predicted nucleic acid-binding protein